MGRDVPGGPCRCDSGTPDTTCCGPVHRGRNAPTPERLMRARYCAYAVGDTRFIIQTTDPDGPHYQRERGTWKAELDNWCRRTTFLGLDVISAHADGDHGAVHFRASLQTDGRLHTMEERSRFRRRKGRWLYIAGD